MNSFNEPILYQNPLLKMKSWEFTHEQDHTAEDLPWHYHKEIEIVLVLEGIHKIYTTNQSYCLHKGDIVLIGSSQLHKPHFVPNQKVTYIVLHFDLEPYLDAAMMHYSSFYLEALHPLERLNELFQNNPSFQEDIGNMILDIHKEIMEKKKGYEIAISMHIKHILLSLLRNDSEQAFFINEYADAQLLHGIMTFVDAHLEEKIDMRTISKQAGMSYVYFSRYFKKKIGISFTEYVNRQRIAKAKRLLVTYDLSITEIAEKVGIYNMAHFYELFKKLNGCTPKQFKAHLKQIGT